MFPSFHNRISILAKTEVAKFWQSVNFWFVSWMGTKDL